ncbi:MAG: cupin [Thermomicrobia bacterium]|nr:cupin [Thermomicrobia bacterium]
MRIYRFDAGVGRPISHFDSDFVMTRIARIAGGRNGTDDLFIGCMHVGAGGIVGYHQATVPQLFLVVAGAGWVRGDAEGRRPIAALEAAFWQRGEWHEAGSETGMTVFVVEGDGVDRALALPETYPGRGLTNPHGAMDHEEIRW